MYVLYRKELYIVKEALTKNRTCQSWRGKQLAMSEDKQALQDFVDIHKDPNNYYIEQQAY